MQPARSNKTIAHANATIGADSNQRNLATNPEELKTRLSKKRLGRDPSSAINPPWIESRSDCRLHVEVSMNGEKLRQSVH
jgi:hypothetical protein